MKKLILIFMVLLIGSSCKKEGYDKRNEGKETDIRVGKDETITYNEAEIRGNEWTVVERYGKYNSPLPVFMFKLKNGNKVVIIKNAQEHIFVLPNYQKGKPIAGNVAWMLFIL